MDTLKEKKMLRFDYYPAYGAIPDLGHLNVHIQWWQGILARDARPTRRNIAFTDLRGLHSRITLCRILEDRSGMVAHIVGEDVKSLFRNHCPKGGPAFEKGIHLRELANVERSSHSTHMRHIADDCHIVISSGTLALVTRRTIDIAAVDFPLAPVYDETPYMLTIYDFQLEPQDRNVPHYGLIPC